MTPSARIQAVIELLEALEQRRASADAILSEYLRERRYIGSTDRRAISGLYYKVLRNRGALNWHLLQLTLPTSPRAYVIIALALLQNQTFEEISGAFGSDPYAPQPLSEDEIYLMNNVVGASLESASMPFWAKHNLPEWAAEELQTQYGEEAEILLDALAQEAPVDLRVNTLKITREKALASLQKDGLDAAPCPYSPVGIRLKERKPLGGTQAFQEGWLEPMDEGSQLVAQATGAQPGEIVVDYCAGAGGKTLALAAMMKGKGRILAHDIDAGRLRELQRRVERADVESMVKIFSGTKNDDKMNAYEGKVDRVILDAPCSGSGTWRRNPELRWRHSEEDLQNFSQLQARLISHAARLLKSGGTFFYITCSLFAQENQEHVKASGILPMDFFPYAIDNLLSNARLSGASNPTTFSLLPHLHTTDGFFLAAWRKE